MADKAGTAERRGVLEASKSVVTATTTGLSKAMRKASGSEFRENWQDFSESVTTILVGLHGEVTALKGRIAELEARKSARGGTILGAIALIVSLVALLVAML
jgi:hypothetical protein